jgi:hypothetical protein
MPPLALTALMPATDWDVSLALTGLTPATDCAMPGADEVISDYAADGRRFYSHSCFGGVWPANLSTIFPWCSFYAGSQRAYLMKEELTGGAHGVEARYPFLDPKVVQEYLWLRHDVKNAEYKRCARRPCVGRPPMRSRRAHLRGACRPVADFLRAHSFPNLWGAKVTPRAPTTQAHQLTRPLPHTVLPLLLTHPVRTVCRWASMLVGRIRQMLISVSACAASLSKVTRSAPLAPCTARLVTSRASE